MTALDLAGSRCYCRRCGRTFRSLGGFDAHKPDRDGCGDPAAAGLVEQGGLWATEAGHAQRDQLAQRLAAARTTNHEGNQP